MKSRSHASGALGLIFVCSTWPDSKATRRMDETFQRWSEVGKLEPMTVGMGLSHSIFVQETRSTMIGNLDEHLPPTYALKELTPGSSYTEEDGAMHEVRTMPELDDLPVTFDLMADMLGPLSETELRNHWDSLEAADSDGQVLEAVITERAWRTYQEKTAKQVDILNSLEFDLFFTLEDMAPFIGLRHSTEELTRETVVGTDSQVYNDSGEHLYDSNQLKQAVNIQRAVRRWLDRRKIHRQAAAEKLKRSASGSPMHVENGGVDARSVEVAKADLYQERRGTNATVASVPMTAQSAVQKWSQAHEAVASSQSQTIELWGLKKDINGIYVYSGHGNDSTPPAYVRQVPANASSKVSLYVTTSGEWCFGTPEDQKERQAKCWLHSAPVPPGTLPQDATQWTWSSAGGAAPAEAVRFWLPHERAEKWQEAMKVIETDYPAIEIMHVELDKSLNGRYEFMKEESNDQSPVFRHESDQSAWLFVGDDTKWWVGPKESMAKKLSSGWMHSEAISPGKQPFETSNWVSFRKEAGQDRGVWFDEPQLQVTASSELEGAASRWERARGALGDRSSYEIWGVEDQNINGIYTLDASRGNPTDPPVFKHEAFDRWLFVATTGQWLVGKEEDFRGRKASGMAYSAVVGAGTLPDKATGWHVYAEERKTWMLYNERLVWTVADVKEVWQKTWDAFNANSLPVLTLTGDDLGVPWRDSLWDLLSPETREQPPLYRHRTKKDLWLSVGADNQWWAGQKRKKDAKSVDGFLRSGAIMPGTLPTDVQSWSVKVDGVLKKKEGVRFK